ncbi:hypothetical protein BLA29_005510 [Euroglyphus maynei]|uniref:Uncharacterized protein n=1 Tax=Euroglyphus maynei TaxID=6958 RepID=A0A1Y3AWQ9_EURMA|nr:hypothetical protein BLA29_005510 [Euroglyphus maynei]
MHLMQSENLCYRCLWLTEYCSLVNGLSLYSSISMYIVAMTMTMMMLAFHLSHVTSHFSSF